MQAHPRTASAKIDEQDIRLGDGSRIGCALAGPSSAAEPAKGPATGLAILYLHGFLGSRLEPFVGGEPAVRLIALDRPGYGRSDPMPAPSLAAFAARVEETLDRLGIERVLVLGVSAGGPYAVAVAARLGARAARLVLVGAVADPGLVSSAPLPMQLLSWLEGHRRLASLGVPSLGRLLGQEQIADLVLRYVLHAEQHGFSSHADVDLVRSRLRPSLIESLARGTAGAETDIHLLATRWGVDLAAIGCPVRVMHAAADHVVPVAHAYWYAQALPQAELEVMADVGHISAVVAAIGRIEQLARDG